MTLDLERRPVLSCEQKIALLDFWKECEDRDVRDHKALKAHNVYVRQQNHSFDCAFASTDLQALSLLGFSM